MSTLPYNSSNKINNTQILFYGKRLYYETVIKQYPDSFVDLWYDKPLYGKVDHRFRPVAPLVELLGTVDDGADKGNIYALDFVAEAFNAMKLYLQQLEFKKKIRKGPFFYPLRAYKGWEDLEILYRTHAQGMFSYFATSYVVGNQGEVNRRIRSFDDYLPFFKDYLNVLTNQVSVPLTKTGFISQVSCPHRVSGLVIEIAEESDFSNDSKKYSRYFKDGAFSLFADITKKFGFYVDMNAPWRLVANLESPAWQQNPILKKIVDKYFKDGYSVEAVFDRNFKTIHREDANNLKVLARAFYNSYVRDEPSIDFAKVCYSPRSMRVPYRSKGVDSKKIYRRLTSDARIALKYSNLYWLRMYMQLRLKEMQKGISQNRVDFEMREIEQRYRIKGYRSALRYVAGRLSIYLEEQYAMFIEKQFKRENLLTNGNAPDIIL